MSEHDSRSYRDWIEASADTLWSDNSTNLWKAEGRRSKSRERERARPGGPPAPSHSQQIAADWAQLESDSANHHQRPRHSLAAWRRSTMSFLYGLKLGDDALFGPSPWFYGACGVAALAVGVMSSRALTAAFVTEESLPPMQVLSDFEPSREADALHADTPEAADEALQAPAVVKQVPSKVPRRQSRSTGTLKSKNRNTPTLSMTPMQTSAPSFAQRPDLDLMDAPSSPMEQQALAHARARKEEESARLIELQRLHDPMAGLEPPPDPGVSLGVLRINSRPWARVFIDKKPAGTTPVLGASVLAGQHQVQLVNEELGMRKVFSVVVKPGESVTRVLELEE